MTARMLPSCTAILALVSSTLAAAAPAPVMLPIGAFSTEAEAQTASDRYKQALAPTVPGISGEVQRADLGAQGIWYAVLVGPFPDRSAADGACVRLKVAG